MILEGDSGTGKTGSLASLVKAGYKLRILDFDNGLDVLRQFVQRDCPDKMENVEFRTIRDKRKTSPSGLIMDGPPKAFLTGLQMLDHWKYDDVDLGKPGTWGPDCVVVVDSLTMMSDAAYNWAVSVNPQRPGHTEPRQWFFEAQKAVENMIALLTAESFGTNVIVISHIRYVTREDGTMKGYPNSVGSALGPTIPTYFNSVALTETKAGEKRVVRTASTAMIDLKSPAPFKMQKELPIETGLAEFFKTVRS